MKKFCLKRKVLWVSIVFFSVLLFIGCASYVESQQKKIEIEKINWTMEKLENAPDLNTLKQIFFGIQDDVAKSAVNYAEKAKAQTDTWYKLTAEDRSVYFIYGKMVGSGSTTILWDMYRQE